MESTPSARPSWWGRHWKWLVPVIVLVAVLSPVVCCGGIVTLALGILKNNEPYRMAVQRVERDPVLMATLGQPIQPGWLVTGSINVSNGGGDADLSFNIRGPSGTGTVYATAERSGGQWTWRELSVHLHEIDERVVLESGGATVP